MRLQHSEIFLLSPHICMMAALRPLTVLNHYNGRGKSSPNKDPLIRDLITLP